ncbi:hypothetical protein H5410_050704 [Solanum commersonii]|uniref:Uncharacterized protein n=1 Tax=Solanum commersonii TaxID=4109 RepID=A0A9J5WXT8_SOLCO|nr:hypothetical protein H5410_050704 [Solanum commersonii]
MKEDQIFQRREDKSVLQPEDDQPLHYRQNEVYARSQLDSSRVPTAATLIDSMPTPTPLMALVPPIIPPPRLLNRLKGDGLQTILEEKLLFTEGLEGKYSNMRDTIHYH